MNLKKEPLICHFCSEEVLWVRPVNPFAFYTLPEGWKKLTPLLGGHYICPKCDQLLDARDKKHDLIKKDPFKEMVIKFVDTTIKRVNQALALNYATQQALIESGLISEEKLKKHISEALKLPDLRIGREALFEMFGDYSSKKTGFMKDPSDSKEKEAIEKIMDMMS